MFYDKKFPAPREVDRYLYWEGHGFYLAPQMFPAPLEVYRELYRFSRGSSLWQITFPALREVDRELYINYYRRSYHD